MVRLYFISYDLIKGKDYRRIIAELERYGAKRVLESMWVLKHAWTSKQLSDHFGKFIDHDDRLMVVGCANILGGWEWASIRPHFDPNKLP